MDASLRLSQPRMATLAAENVVMQSTFLCCVVCFVLYKDALQRFTLQPFRVQLMIELLNVLTFSGCNIPFLNYTANTNNRFKIKMIIVLKIMTYSTVQTVQAPLMMSTDRHNSLHSLFIHSALSAALTACRGDQSFRGICIDRVYSRATHLFTAV